MTTKAAIRRFNKAGRKEKERVTGKNRRKKSIQYMLYNFLWLWWWCTGTYIKRPSIGKTLERIVDNRDLCNSLKMEVSAFSISSKITDKFVDYIGVCKFVEYKSYGKGIEGSVAVYKKLVDIDESS
ncbi:hypothetical protein J3Q64DRAFT_1822960 [Phycomyces blakesleeanus]|uniref:Uncharacterized protein n=2 Tax=Phycomyces blakesleeanus TaxID=4837 RepID=A0A167PMZ0_PHYB8|nr:hypothetical protein PHYBLDRAFT_163351 [Phycomyces blakesleeanus NRRL 1555(-)]OAD78234.1 hypothetical protein PHYBLDRAFT_163351 [Phycomyces blakesleeanus NRRL 1555(-)]|eukprot:XP_018296274.1 hypothetical protein PHYBLDRAFT_163351 [Phycomyces blakesleeanus NRRL 1555(-)]